MRALRPQNDGEILESAALLAPISDGGVRRPVPSDIPGRHGLPQNAETFGIVIGQRIEQHGFNHAEDRRVGAHREREN